MKHTINDSIAIEEKFPVLPIKNRAKNYALDDILLEKLEPFDGMGVIFTEPMGCSQELNEMFSDVLEDLEFPTALKLKARRALKGAVDNAYQMADDVGQEGIKKLELIMNKFKSWCNKNVLKKPKKKNITSLMRPPVPMTNEKYTSNVKKVMNTHHM